MLEDFAHVLPEVRNKRPCVTDSFQSSASPRNVPHQNIDPHPNGALIEKHDLDPPYPILVGVKVRLLCYVRFGYVTSPAFGASVSVRPCFFLHSGWCFLFLLLVWFSVGTHVLFEAGVPPEALLPAQLLFSGAAAGF